ncbi:MAG: SDR family NAD(P)-dependent oxidoreductase [Alphaproteobacteria bacterium]|nr:SDR family NAD(P)-dependent oxidoreductase [Alphaproteobacteria bacterium]MCB9699050.1 SDR family NAD(P)-dependent oxidoreductase [Alphaproteobacteria bacterium]
MSLFGMFQGQGPNGFGHETTADEVLEGVDLSGRCYLVTGCNSGLGLETLSALTKRGARVMAVARTAEKAGIACAAASPKGEAVPFVCEMSDPTSVRECIDTVRRDGRVLAGIVANAGVMALPKHTMVRGVETQLFCNHVAHFMLVTGLLDQLVAGEGRVVVVSSRAHERTWPEGIRLDDLGAVREYSPWQAYGQSKLANILFVRSLATRLGAGQSTNALHPGVVGTNIARHLGALTSTAFQSIGTALFAKTPEQGAATQTYLAAHPQGGEYSGGYWVDCNPATPSAHAQDDALAEALWERTTELVRNL